MVPTRLPPFLFAVHTKITPDTLRSNSLRLFVKVPNVDLKKGFADIKKPYGAPVTFKEIAPWILGYYTDRNSRFLDFVRYQPEEKEYSIVQTSC